MVKCVPRTIASRHEAPGGRIGPHAPIGVHINAPCPSPGLHFHHKDSLVRLCRFVTIVVGGEHARMG
jgi:hypothetical protein